MQSLSYISGSDGTANASLMTIQSVRSPGASTILVNTVAGVPTKFYGSMGTPHTFTDPVTSETITVVSEATAVDFAGHVDGGNIEIDAIAPGYTDNGSQVGDVIIVRPVTEWANNLFNVLSVSLNDDGTLKAVTDNPGWTDLPAVTISSVTANGNRSYDLATSTDLTGVISPGMRLRTTRTVAAPAQCATFDGTNDYFSKTTPAGMTFTDDFVVGAWVKLSAYGPNPMGIISRWNGTSGWFFYLNANGTVVLQGTNGAAVNFRRVVSYQSIPLNKWVHITAQLDMSTYTATGTTCYVMIDGVNVPVYLETSGTNPTAIVQAGDFNIGSYNNDTTRVFSGKIAQAFVSSAKITQDNVRTLMSQGLTPALITANNIISAYSLSNDINDLNTTSANNLTANGGVLATTADSPFGGQAGGTISSTLDYGIVQAISPTTITVQVAEGCTIPTSGGVSAVSYSTYKSPYGFPAQRGRWSVTVKLRNDHTAAGTGGVVKNTNGVNINVPIGSFVVELQSSLYITRGGTGSSNTYGGLSTANNSFTDDELVVGQNMGSVSATATLACPVNIKKDIQLASATPYYLVDMATSGSTFQGFLGSVSATTITATPSNL